VSLELDAITYTYAKRSQPALHEVSAVFQPGEVALLIGASGSGKTTLIRCVNGLIPRAYKEGTLNGQIRCFGESTAALSLAQIASRVATVLQDPEKQIVATTVRSDLAFGLENLGQPREDIQARVAKVAEQLDIAHLLNRETHTLSGGERQRVVIAGVLAAQPPALLLDEPLAALDPPSAREALDLFAQLAREGKTVVLIEHRVRDVLRIAPAHCLALDAGRITFRGDATACAKWIGPPDDATLAPPRNPQGASLLAFDAVHFGYANTGREQASGVSLNVRAGDVIALLGPNGAGKSTLCRLAIGLIRPTSGSISISGSNIAARTTAEIVRDVGYVFQNPSSTLFANTLREELSFGPRNIGIGPAETARDIERVLTMIDLPGLDLDKSPFALSHGQQKRIALAAVLTMRPRVLLMDEPTAGLDEDTAEVVMRGLFSAEGRPDAIVMITHDLRLARRYANRAVILNQGRIIADGAPDTLLDDAGLLARGGLA
jgi:energy-coupling factor transport system ATP-binding protein